MIPMEAVLPAAAAGALTGVAIRALWPARPDVVSVMDRLNADHIARQPRLTATGSLPEKVGTRLLAAFGERITLPVRDLNLLRVSPAEHLGKRFLFALYGLVLPQLASALLSMLGVSLPFVMPAAAGLGLAVLFWLWPGQEVKKEAAAARLVVRHAAASYLDRVALARIANSGAAQALTDTADVGDGWIFERMRQAFYEADLAGVTVWDALKQLGEELDIPELTRPADTLALAGDGAAVYTTLQAQARQLRVAILSDAKAHANEASTSMVLPVTFAVLLMLVFVVLPPVVSMFNG
ncbi:type II secretion system F family protein [Streptomyces erythrochromogenes]|uniref:type II secretion system F family protein n=1 Tax=Streptomyces erythrochromogenes TaxID=285574 RepID=UPI0036B21FE7